MKSILSLALLLALAAVGLLAVPAGASHRHACCACCVDCTDCALCAVDCASCCGDACGGCPSCAVKH